MRRPVDPDSAHCLAICLHLSARHGWVPERCDEALKFGRESAQQAMSGAGRSAVRPIGRRRPNGPEALGPADGLLDGAEDGVPAVVEHLDANPIAEAQKRR